MKVAAREVIAQVLRRLGISEAHLDDAVAPVAEANGVTAQGTLDTAHELEIPAPLLENADYKSLAEEAEGMRMGTLGIHTLKHHLDGGPRKANDIGKLPTLSAIDFASLAADTVDRMKLRVEVPVKEGRCRLPVGDGRHFELEVEVGTRFIMDLDIRPGSNGLVIQGGSLQATRPMVVKNAGDFSVASGTPLGSAVNVLDVVIRGLSFGRDGQINLNGHVKRPSINPLKHMFSDGKTTSIALSMMQGLALPRINTDAMSILAGKFLSRDSLLAMPPPNLDMPRLMQALGAVTEQGTFSFTMSGNTGLVDVGSSQMVVRREASPFEVRVSGNFDIEGSGALRASLSGAIDTDVADGSVAMEARIQATEDGFVGHVDTIAKAVLGEHPIRIDLGDVETSVGVADTNVRVGDKSVRVALKGAALDVFRKAEETIGMSIGDDVQLKLDGKVLAAAGFDVTFGPNGLQVSTEEIDTLVSLAGTQVDGSKLDVSLGERSGVEMTITNVSLGPNGLRLENAIAGFAVELASGHVKKGIGDARLKEGDDLSKAAGVIEISPEDGVSAAVSYRIKANPGALGLRSPVGVEAKGKAVARLFGDRIEITPDRPKTRAIF